MGFSGCSPLLLVLGARVLERRWAGACPDCWSSLIPLVPPFCSKCGEPAPAIDPTQTTSQEQITGLNVIDIPYPTTRDSECTGMMRDFIAQHPDLWSEDIGDPVGRK